MREKSAAEHQNRAESNPGAPELSLRLIFTLKRRSCRDQEPGSNGRDSLEAQQQQATTESKEVAEMQQECRYSVKVQASEDTRAAENTA